MRALAMVVVVAVLLAGCAVPARAPLRIAPVVHRAGPALRLDNGTVELVVVPGIARIVRYGLIGGANALWEPAVAPAPGGWANHGGDRLWPWPQRDWPAWIGTAWPPPAGFDQPHTSELVDGRTLRLVSPVFAAYGLRAVREISLGDATEVVIRNRLERVAVPTAVADLPVAVWSISQVPLPQSAGGNRVAGSTLRVGYVAMREPLWPGLAVDALQVVVPRGPFAQPGKIGLDADRLWCVQADGMRFEQDCQGGPLSAYQPGERAQIYRDADAADPAAGCLELEFTSPTRRLAIGEAVETVVHWRLIPLTH